MSLAILGYAEDIFSKLKSENYLLDKSSNEIPESLTYYLSEINVLHPFREGNGRTQRVFIEYLAQSAGYYVDFSGVGSDEMIEASVLSFDKDYGKMNEMFERITAPITPQEQQLYRKKLGLDRLKRASTSISDRGNQAIKASNAQSRSTTIGTEKHKPPTTEPNSR